MPGRFWMALMVFYVAVPAFLTWELVARAATTANRLVVAVAWVSASLAYFVLVWWWTIRLTVDSRELTRSLLRTRVQRTSLNEIIGANVEAARWSGYSIVVVSLRDGSVLRLLTQKPTALAAAIVTSTES